MSIKKFKAQAKNSRVSKKQKIKDHLLKGETIDWFDALRLYRTRSLSQRISELRKDGLPIHTEMIHKDGSIYAVYWIEPDFLKGV